MKIISGIVKFFSPPKGPDLSLLPPSSGVLSQVQSGRGVMLKIHNYPLGLRANHPNKSGPREWSGMVGHAINSLGLR